jgi:sulfate adenylyltransferase subunit 1 (EFTu-like GTPase family)
VRQQDGPRRFDPAVYDRIREEFQAFTAQLRFADVRFLPISALMGDNVVHRSSHTPWYSGGSMLDILETVDVQRQRATSRSSGSRCSTSCVRTSIIEVSPRRS